MNDGYALLSSLHCRVIQQGGASLLDASHLTLDSHFPHRWYQHYPPGPGNKIVERLCTDLALTWFSSCETQHSYLARKVYLYLSPSTYNLPRPYTIILGIFLRLSILPYNYFSILYLVVN